MTEIRDEMMSILKLYDYKFFIDDVDLLEDFKKDMETLSIKFKNGIRNLYTNMLMEHEPMIRKLFINISRLKDRYKLSEDKDLEIKSKTYSHCIINKYFEISNYIEKLDVINTNGDKSFVDVTTKELFPNLEGFINNSILYFIDNHMREPIIQSESILTYNSAIIENLNNLEDILNEITKVFELINIKFNYYCDFITKIKEFDTKIIINLHEKNKLFLDGLNREYSTISSRSIIIQWIYYELIMNLYNILKSDASDILKEFNSYLDYLNTI